MGIYERSPIVAQNLVCWAYGAREARVRYGRRFHQIYRSLLESEHWKASDIAAFQDERVSNIVKDAYENVPYYRDVMRGLSLSPQDVRGVRDLEKMPVLTKELVRRNFAALRSRAHVPSGMVSKHTSGTTGTSLKFEVSREAIAFQWALAWRHRQRFGLEFGALHANFTGKLAVPPAQRAPPYWRWCAPLFQAYLNMHHLTPGKIEHVVRFLGQHEFEFYSGYPSIIHVLGEVAMERGVALERRPRVVSLAAENTFAWQRESIERFTGAVVTDLYGMSEACGNASRCTSGVYHEDFEFGVLGRLGAHVQDDGRVQAQILCTGLVDAGFPLIRYEVGDTGVWEQSGRKCGCGRESTMLVSIEGRSDDYVITPEGRRLMRFDYLFKAMATVRECQVVQRQLGAVVLHVVRRDGYTTADEMALRSEMARWISPRLVVEFNYVEEIPRGPNGKFRAVVSELRRDAASVPKALT